MSRARSQKFLEAAKSEGLLPPEATLPQADDRPWPVVVLTGLGAWLAAIPLFVVAALLLGDLVRSGFSAFIIGSLLLIGALVVLRARDVSLFIEQLGIPFLITGLCLMGVGLASGVSERGTAAFMCLLHHALGFVLPQNWLRV